MKYRCSGSEHCLLWSTLQMGFPSTTRRDLRISEGKSAVKVLDFVADIRRVATGMEMNDEARKTRQEESIGYPDGKIVKFSSDVDLSLMSI